MTQESPHPGSGGAGSEIHAHAPPGSRLRLLADVLMFQFKLLLDGLRDLLLSPISIASAVLGLIAGGDRPDRYFNRVLKLGRRTEVWINLFGRYRGHGTSDDLVDPFRSRVLEQAQSSAWLNKAGGHINKGLDEVNSALLNTTRRSLGGVRPRPPDSTRPGED